MLLERHSTFIVTFTILTTRPSVPCEDLDSWRVVEKAIALAQCIHSDVDLLWTSHPLYHHCLRNSEDTQELADFWRDEESHRALDLERAIPSLAVIIIHWMMMVKEWWLLVWNASIAWEETPLLPSHVVAKDNLAFRSVVARDSDSALPLSLFLNLEDALAFRVVVFMLKKHLWVSFKIFHSLDVRIDCSFHNSHPMILPKRRTMCDHWSPPFYLVHL